MHQDSVAHAGNIWMGLKPHRYKAGPDSVYTRWLYALADMVWTGSMILKGWHSRYGGSASLGAGS